jgi:hypothetical protein
MGRFRALAGKLVTVTRADLDREEDRWQKRHQADKPKRKRRGAR